VSEVPPEIFRKRDGRLRMIAWVLLAIILFAFALFSFLGLLPAFISAPTQVPAGPH
jgi:hypothetical protein